jgi:hypothetical protein
VVQATGVNFYAKPWALGFLDFATQFTPPGSKIHAFGDGSETKPDTRVFHAFGSRMVSPRAAWYVKNLGGTEDTLSLLQAPYPMPVADTKVLSPPSSTAYYPSTGWVSMHSDIGLTSRSSLYFKSSPYGSFNHSHGDQNGLLLSVAGQPLLVKAGWYDWYGSPYWTDWYHQTRSQNAITFDGGKGQLVTGYREQLQRNGKIIGYAAQPSYDFAEGDATASYGGQLTMARRQVWHLRNAGNAILVRDRLSATVPHTYEFNLHAPVAMTVESPSAVKIAINGQSVCVRSLNKDASFAKWIGPGAKTNVVEDHGAFYLPNDGKSVAEFLVLLDVGCKQPAVQVSTSGTVRTVTVGGQTVTLTCAPPAGFPQPLPPAGSQDVPAAACCGDVFSWRRRHATLGLDRPWSPLIALNRAPRPVAPPAGFFGDACASIDGDTSTGLQWLPVRFPLPSSSAIRCRRCAPTC